VDWLPDVTCFGSETSDPVGVKGTKGLPVTCPSCNSPYWNTKAKTEKKLLPLMFHGEEVIDSNFEEVVKEQDKAGRKK
jgi:hypothetical protein